MVENKKAKRQRDIKAKLMAAIAMLLVSSIMMVSTTYAWFTLSTAPEVQGITTTIASNGNLEIALSPVSGNPNEVKDAGMSTGSDWAERNLTWGNLLDMSDADYNLAKLTLAPAQLVMSGTVGAYTLGTFPLATPHYGADGRISTLTPDASIGGTTMPSAANSYVGAPTDGYTGGAGDYGVRAVGTSSGLSAQQLLHKTSVGEISSFANKASAAAGASLQDKGNALASIMVTHASKSGADDSNYADYVDELQSLTAALDESVGYIDDALRAALRGMATTITDATQYDLALQLINDESKSITEIVNTIETTYGVSTDALDTVLAKRDAVAANVTAAQTAADDLDASGTVSWNDVYGVVSYLMETNGVTINNYSVDDIKNHMDDPNFLLGLAKDTQIQLGAGSGVYYDIAEIAGNIVAKTTNVDIDVSSFNVGFDKVTLETIIIKTVYTGTPVLTAVKTAVNGLTPAGSTAAVMDAFYGYVLDLMLRTNAADSHLYLQTEATQRVYSDSANEQTMGKGATIVMSTTDAANVGPMQSLCESIYIAFFDPVNGNKILGVAKVTNIVMTSVTDGTTTTYTITGSLSLCDYTVDGNGLVTVGNAKADDDTTGNVDESKLLCALTQNVPQAVSALVYLDGNTVTSADVLADETVTATLNLQFASSAELKPMENSELKNGATTNP